ARAQEKGSLVISGTLIVVFAVMIYLGMRWPLRASLPVYFIAGVGLLLTFIQIARDAHTLRRQTRTGTAAIPFSRVENLLEFQAWLWLAGLVAALYLFGFHLTFFFYPLAYGYVYGADLKRSLAISVSAVALLWLIFAYFAGRVGPDPLFLPFLY